MKVTRVIQVILGTYILMGLFQVGMSLLFVGMSSVSSLAVMLAGPALALLACLILQRALVRQTPMTDRATVAIHSRPLLKIAAGVLIAGFAMGVLMLILFAQALH